MTTTTIRIIKELRETEKAVFVETEVDTAYGLRGAAVLVDETARHLSHLPEAPEAPTAKTISVELIDQMRALEAEERARLVDEITAPKSPASTVDQWGVDTSEFIKHAVFLDDEPTED